MCIPDGAAQRVPVIFCHHQHAGQFGLGKSEVVGLRGDPDQAYAAELAGRGYLTISPDASQADLQLVRTANAVLGRAPGSRPPFTRSTIAIRVT